MYLNMHVEVKQQPSGICFLLPPWTELSLPAESSYQSPNSYNFERY